MFDLTRLLSDNLLVFRDAPSIDVQLALKRSLRSAAVVDGVSRGLHQCVKDLDK